jgi:hypothetical protein
MELLAQFLRAAFALASALGAVHFEFRRPIG